jgi:biopolymer transport protein ExbD
MTNKISFYDHTTGEQVERDMTAAEQKERDDEVAVYAQKKADLEAEVQSVRNLKVAAYEKMGLSADEIEALLPTSKPFQRI